MENLLLVKITGYKGNGNFGSPLTNTPFGYQVYENGKLKIQMGKF